MIKIYKEEKGITMISLILTVMLLIIITGALVGNSRSTVQLSNFTKLQNDIEALNDRVAAYFVEKGELPIYKDEELLKANLRTVLSDMSINDGEEYYTIDLEEIGNPSLNYGEGYRSFAPDRYIINGESHIIYYFKGITYEGKTYHTVGKNKAVID